MTISEMHIQVELLLQKIGTYAIDNFLREEVDVYLNRAQDKFIKNRFSAMSDVKRQGFEAIVKRLEDLRILHVRETLVDPTVVGAEYHFDLPGTYMFYIAATVDSKANPCGTATQNSPVTTGKVRVVETQDFYDMRRNPFAKSRPDTPLALILEDSLVIDTVASFIPQTVKLEFLRKPSIMVYDPAADCELPEHTHQEIVNLAVQEMLENIESQRYQSHSVQTALDD